MGYSDCFLGAENVLCIEGRQAWILTSPAKGTLNTTAPVDACVDDMPCMFVC